MVLWSVMATLSRPRRWQVSTMASNKVSESLE